MERNDYRRALIMLRSLLNGYSGHARIEIRTMMGNLNIRACIPQGAQSVRAALVGRRTYEYFAYPLGNLRRDMRGQAGLSVNFDPRDIGGRMLDAYSLLALVTINDGNCELALVGNLNGSQEMDWSRVRDAVCALYAPQPRGIIEEPAAEEAQSVPETVASADSEPIADEAADDEEIFKKYIQEDFADETSDEGIVFEKAQPDGGTLIFDGKDIISPEEDAPYSREGWTFARMELPGECGYAYAYVGMPVCGGEMCCALPGVYSVEPPVGLDDYYWSGGTGRGYWVKCYPTS